MTDRSACVGFLTRLLYGFIAGFFATLVFHQLTLAVLRAAPLPEDNDS